MAYNEALQLMDKANVSEYKEASSENSCTVGTVLEGEALCPLSFLTENLKDIMDLLDAKGQRVQ